MKRIIYQGTPSLPYTFNWTPDVDGQVLLYFSGSAWTSAPNQKIGLKLSINNTPVGETSVWINNASSHQTLTPSLLEFNMPMNFEDNQIQPVSITIEAISNATNFDVNDQVILAFF